jgi:hypothetical protein
LRPARPLLPISHGVHPAAIELLLCSSCCFSPSPRRWRSDLPFRPWRLPAATHIFGRVLLRPPDHHRSAGGFEALRRLGRACSSSLRRARSSSIGLRRVHVCRRVVKPRPPLPDLVFALLVVVVASGILACFPTRRRTWVPCSTFTTSASSFVCSRASTPSRHPTVVLDKKPKRIVMPSSTSNGNCGADTSTSSFVSSPGLQLVFTPKI